MALLNVYLRIVLLFLNVYFYRYNKRVGILIGAAAPHHLEINIVIAEY